MNTSRFAAKHGRQPAADNRTNNPKNTGQYKAAAIISRHDEFSDSPGNKTKDDPRDNTHSDRYGYYRVDHLWSYCRGYR